MLPFDGRSLIKSRPGFLIRLLCIYIYIYIYIFGMGLSVELLLHKYVQRGHNWKLLWLPRIYLWYWFLPNCEYIYIIISKNIRYLLWNRGLWRSLNNTYPIFLTPCIRCTNHLCDSSDLTDVNPHFIPSLLQMIQNVDLLWRHRYKSRPPTIVTSQWPIVPAWLLWTLS